MKRISTIKLLPTIRFSMAAVYFTSAVLYVTHLSLTGFSGISDLIIGLTLTGTVAWAIAATQSITRRSYTLIKDIRKEDTEDELFHIRPSSHATINSALHIVSSSSFIAAELSVLPEFNTLNYLRLTASTLWFTNSVGNCWLARRYQFKQENSTQPIIKLCGTKPQILSVINDAEILVSGIFYASAIWLNNPVYPLRVAGNICWIMGALLEVTHSSISVMGSDPERSPQLFINIPSQMADPSLGGVPLTPYI